MITFIAIKDWTDFFCTGQKYYYNKKTQVSQWEPPQVMQPASKVLVPDGTSRNVHDGIWLDQSSMPERCLGCGGWGVGLVQAWGYCNHCTRYIGFCCQQFPLPVMHMVFPVFNSNKFFHDIDRFAQANYFRKGYSF